MNEHSGQTGAVPPTLNYASQPPGELPEPWDWKNPNSPAYTVRQILAIALIWSALVIVAIVCLALGFNPGME